MEAAHSDQFTPGVSGPFGNPDAARASALDEFIDINGVIISPVHDKNAMRRRILVGRKGSGKSLYLRIHRQVAINHDFIVVDATEYLSTGLVLQIESIAKADYEYISQIGLGTFINQSMYKLNFWSQIWEKAVYLSLFTIALSKSDLTAKKKDDLVKKYRDINVIKSDHLENIISPVSIIKMFSETLSLSRGQARRWRTFLDNSNWDLLRQELSVIFGHLPPIAIYVDAIDDDFEDAPEPWLNCQGGLFKTAFEVLYRDTKLSNRVHIVLAIRDVSYAHLIHKSEHAARYVSDGRTEHLIWDKSAVRKFLNEKIARLDPSYSEVKNADPAIEPFRYWLGFESLKNERRQIVERVSDYIIRHTRLLPRDIVVMGNGICERMEKRRSEGKLISEGPLRQRVSDVANFIANEAMNLCVNELCMSAEYMSTWAREDLQGLKGTAAFRQINADIHARVKVFFQLIERETCTREELEKAMLESKVVSYANLNQDDDIFRFDNILWRHGLLAAKEPQGAEYRWKFNWRGTLEGMNIDQSATLYGFHSILIDRYRLSATREGPVF